MPLSLSFAQAYLGSNLSWDDEPALSQEEQLALLAQSRAVDVNLVSPDGEDYVTTYTYDSLNLAVFLGWRMKKAKAVEYHLEDEDEIWQHIKEMLAYWGAIASVSQIGGPISVDAYSQSVVHTAVW